MTKGTIILKPVVTEKSMNDSGKGIYTFSVVVSANKSQIKKEVEKLFKVKVVGIKTAIFKGKIKTAAKTRKKIKSADQKKAWVVLKTGDKIDLFEKGK